MPKGYWIATYRSVSNPGALAQYAKLAGPILEARGGKILARGLPARNFEGQAQRSVIVEFASVDAAIAAYRALRTRRRSPSSRERWSETCGSSRACDVRRGRIAA